MVRFALSLITVAALFGCAVLEDNGTHLAFAMERAAAQLRESGRDEQVMEYVPMSGADQAYEVRMNASLSTTAPYGGYIVVTGKNGGGTSYQGRYVYIPKAMHIGKQGESTFITLRNNQGRIDVVGLR